MVLNKYRDGFSVLDVDQVRGVWPAVNVPGLRQHFSGLAEQNLEFDNCRVSLAGSRATAVCSGSLSYVANGRNPQVRTERRQWQFTLRTNRGRWQITSVAARLPGRIAARPAF